jgi:unsaturated rhamnogalacturonyl hydrolase
MARSSERKATARELVERVARRTMRYDFTVWFWGDAIAMDGLVDAAEVLHDAAARDFCQGYFARWADRPPAWTDYLAPGSALLRASRLTGDQGLLDRAIALADWHANCVPRAPGTGIHLYRPDLPAYRHTMWVDSLYHVPPFLARLGQMTGETHRFDEAAASYETHARALESGRGPLLAHSYDTGADRQKGYGWGRGNGWAVCGLLETLECLPRRHPQRAALLQRFRRLCAALLPLQDASGCWRTLLHDRESYLESSTAAMYAFAFLKGMRLGLLPRRFAEPAERAWRYVVSRIDAEGGLWGVSWSWSSPQDETGLYKGTPTEINVWGQGAALRAAVERLRGA